MNILILDDQKIRHEAFHRIYQGHNVVSVFRFSDFVSQLDKVWDIIHLDHDLGDWIDADTFVDGWGKTQEFTGQHAALKVCEMKDELKPKQVIIQSINPEGAMAMKGYLERANIQVVWEPFGDVS